MLYIKRNWHSLENSADRKEEYQYQKSFGPETEPGDHQQPREPERTPVFSTAAPSSVLRSTQSKGVSGESAEYQVQNWQGVTICSKKQWVSPKYLKRRQTLNVGFS